MLRLFFHYLVSNPKYILKYLMFMGKKTFNPICIFTTKYGFKINLNLRRGVASEIYLGKFEEQLTDFYLKSLSNDDIFFDIGTNIGYFTLLASKKIHQGKIFCFDADPMMIKQVENNLIINKITNASVYNKGINDSKGELDFFIADDPAFSSFNEPFGRKTIQINKIETICLDDFVAENKINRIDYIKMDIEGAELNGLKGAINILKNIKPVLSIEISDNTYSKFGYCSHDLFKFMKDLGYEFFNYTNGVLKKEIILDKYIYENFIFIHKDKIGLHAKIER